MVFPVAMVSYSGRSFSYSNKGSVREVSIQSNHNRERETTLRGRDAVKREAG